jgi:hypothetical protein
MYGLISCTLAVVLAVQVFALLSFWLGNFKVRGAAAVVALAMYLRQSHPCHMHTLRPLLFWLRSIQQLALLRSAVVCAGSCATVLTVSCTCVCLSCRQWGCA